MFAKSALAEMTEVNAIFILCLLEKDIREMQKSSFYFTRRIKNPTLRKERNGKWKARRNDEDGIFKWTLQNGNVIPLQKKNFVKLVT